MPLPTRDRSAAFEPDFQDRSRKIYPGEALITLNGEQRKARADQLMTASKQRLKNRLGILSSADVTAIETAVLLQLAIRR
jgi:mRNA interferase MazF